MPLLPGRKNIGKNIETEEAHGKPKAQATAIALRTAGVPKKGSDDLAFVGSEYEPSRRAAFAKHAAGVTRSQDRRRARDISGEEVRSRLGIPEELWKNLSSAEKREKVLEAIRLRGKVSDKRRADDYTKTRADIEADIHYYTGMVKATEAARARRGDVETDADLRFYKDALAREQKELSKLGIAKDTELPVPIKTSSLVPMPSGENNEVRYAPRRAGDRRRAADMHQLSFGGLPVATHAGNPTGCQYCAQFDALSNADKQAFAKTGGSLTRWLAERKGKGADRRRAADSIIRLPEQRSGSEPADHLHRANRYEIDGDRARALDSYRAAASGFRRAGDKTNEAKARDGVEACQTKFATQYDSPSRGRVRVCDSAEQALQSALARTRSGESVMVLCRTVRPRSRARAADDTTGVFQKAEYRGWSIDKVPSGQLVATKFEEGFPLVAQSMEHAKALIDEQEGPSNQPMEASDERLGFKKLEGELSKEKGVSDPGALAASIGRKKYGASGMAAKAAAGRARDAKWPGEPVEREHLERLRKFVAQGHEKFKPELEKMEAYIKKQAAKYGTAGMAKKAAAGRAKDASLDEDAREVAQIFKTKGKPAAIAKMRELAQHLKVFEAAALQDKVLLALVPGQTREDRLRRNEVWRTGRADDKEVQPV